MDTGNARTPEFWIRSDPVASGTQNIPAFHEIERGIPLLPSKFRAQNLKTYILHLRKLNSVHMSRCGYSIDLSETS
jgi:hypothetical protein